LSYLRCFLLREAEFYFGRSFFRDQWPSTSSNCITAMTGFDLPVEKIHGGLGTFAIYDRAGEGVLTEWSLNGLYSYIGKINEDFKVRSAVQLSLGNKHLNVDNLTFPDQIDPRHGFVFNTNASLPEDGLNKTYFDLGLSAAADFRKFTFGVSGFHLTSPDVGFIAESHLDRKYAAFLGYDLWMMKGEKPTGFCFSPLVFVNNEFGGTNFLAGSNFSWNTIYIGSYYRYSNTNADAVILSGGARLGKFQFGYSYDYTVSKLTNASGGSHELFLNFFFDKNDKK
jgi:type IX secretion system PorP/SprF family membrane protein